MQLQWPHKLLNSCKTAALTVPHDEIRQDTIHDSICLSTHGRWRLIPYFPNHLGVLLIDYCAARKTNAAALKEYNLSLLLRLLHPVLRAFKAPAVKKGRWMTYVTWRLSDPSKVTPSFSQLRRGVGIPVALHTRVSSSPRGALTSDGCSESRMVGDTEWDKDYSEMPLKIIAFMSAIYDIVEWAFLYPALWGCSLSVFVPHCSWLHRCMSQHETEWGARAPACSLGWTTATADCSLDSKRIYLHQRSRVTNS